VADRGDRPGGGGTSWDDEAASLAFSAIYFAETILKIGAMGWRSYWDVASNRFDLGFTALAIVG
jgi:hypothetical protein